MQGNGKSRAQPVSHPTLRRATWAERPTNMGQAPYPAPRAQTRSVQHETQTRQQKQKRRAVPEELAAHKGNQHQTRADARGHPPVKCYHPLKAYKTSSGITFKANDATIIGDLELPCGQCIGCRENRRLQNKLRILHEQTQHDDNCFVTLTYERDKLPPGRSLEHKDFADFMKRLRHHAPQGVRFFMCGEYGPKEKRPHYHACLFGIDFKDRKPRGTSSGGHQFYEDPLLTRLWGHGFATVQDLVPETAGYCAGYINKKALGKGADQANTRTDESGASWTVRPEYAVMSKGLGLAWLEKYHRDIYPHDFVIVNGRKHPVPRYYKQKLKELKPTEYDHDSIEYERVKKAREHAADNTDERLKVQEIVHLAKIKDLTRIDT